MRKSPVDASPFLYQCGMQFSNTDLLCLKVVSEKYEHSPASYSCRHSLCMKMILAEYDMKTERMKCFESSQIIFVTNKAFQNLLHQFNNEFPSVRLTAIDKLL